MNYTSVLILFGTAEMFIISNVFFLIGIEPHVIIECVELCLKLFFGVIFLIITLYFLSIRQSIIAIQTINITDAKDMQKG